MSVLKVNTIQGVDGRGIKDTRKLLYIDWMK